MRIKWPIGLAVFPVLSAIQTAHQGPGLSSGEDATWQQGIERNPADVTGVGSWGKTPGWSRGQLTERGKLSPGSPTILGAEERTRLSACIDHASVPCALQSTHSDRHHMLRGDALVDMLPRIACIVTVPHTLIKRATVDLFWV